MSSYYEKFLATGKVKCIDGEIPFEIPKGWSVCRLNDLAVYRKGPFGSSLTKSMFVPKSDTSIKVYEQKNAIQKNYELGEYYISKAKYEMMQSFIVEPSDIIVSCAGTIGETYQLPSTAPIGIINQALMRVKLYNLEIAKYWEMYFRYILLNEAEMKGAGSAIKNIPPFEYLKAIIVTIPPMAEQKRIIDRYLQLSALSDNFDVLQKELNNLNSEIFPFIKKSILQEAIQGKLVPQITEEGTAKELLEQIRKEKQKLVTDGKLKKSALSDSIICKGDDNKYYEQIGNKHIDITNSIPFDIPLSWQWIRLGTLFNHCTGKALNASNKEGVMKSYITTSNLYWNHFALDKLKQMPFTENELDKCTVTYGDLLVCEGGDIGRAAVWREDYNICIQNHVHKLRSFIPTCIMFYFYVFYFYKSAGYIGGKGIGIQGLSSRALDQLPIPLPPKSEQERIVEKIEILFDKIKK